MRTRIGRRRRIREQPPRGVKFLDAVRAGRLNRSQRAAFSLAAAKAARGVSFIGLSPWPTWLPMSDLLDKCEICGALLDEEDLFCGNCGAEAPERDEQAPVQHTAQATHSFQCKNCGASMSYSATAGSLQCPFCGSVELLEKPPQRVLAPERVVPLAINREQANQLLRRWLGKGFWRPGDLAERAKVVAMTPVYVPYWVFSADTHTYWTADTNRTPPGSRSNWYPISGEHRGRHEGLLIGASSVLTAKETYDLCPFDLAYAVPPEQVDLQSITVEQFTVPRKYARPLARQGLESLERDACIARYIGPGNRNVKVNVRIENLRSEPVLLPVWIMAYHYGEGTFRFLINGQTGKVTGRAPVSKTKIAMAVVIAIAVVLILMLIAAVGGRF